MKIEKKSKLNKNIYFLNNFEIRKIMNIFHMNYNIIFLFQQKLKYINIVEKKMIYLILKVVHTVFMRCLSLFYLKRHFFLNLSLRVLRF